MEIHLGGNFTGTEDWEQRLFSCVIRVE